MAAHHVVRRNGHELRIWGLKVTLAGLKCETCHAEFLVDTLQELAEERAIKNIGTPDVYCCTWPPSLATVQGASNISSLLIRCGLGTPTGTPPGRTYIMERRGVEFRMHGIASSVFGSALSCNICKREFPLEKVAAALDVYMSAGSLCRDITCCQEVEHASAGVGCLGRPTGTGAPSSEPKPVCRWCKGAGEITINFKTKPCDCVKQERAGAGWDALRAAGRACAEQKNIAIANAILGEPWEVKKKFNTSAGD